MFGGLAGRSFSEGRWEPERPETKSLWLLPSGPDQVGDSLVRPTPAAHMGEVPVSRKFTARVRSAFIDHSRAVLDSATALPEAD